MNRFPRQPEKDQAVFSAETIISNWNDEKSRLIFVEKHDKIELIWDQMTIDYCLE